jgi:hypothetical protein
MPRIACIVFGGISRAIAKRGYRYEPVFFTCGDRALSMA